MNDPLMNSQQPLLEVRDLLRRTMRGTILIEHVSFNVCAGERWAIVGETGSGKTVLLRCLAMLDPCEGQIRWKGESISSAEIPEYRSRVIYLPQASPGVEGTVEENLRLPFSLKIHQSRSYLPEATVKHLTLFRKQSNFLQRQFSDLSGGERQIVALLRVLQLSPQILLLDEASSALDPESELVFERLVHEWLVEASEKRAVLWVSHDGVQRQRVSDREYRLERQMIEGSAP